VIAAATGAAATDTSGYRAALLTAAGLATLGIGAAALARGRPAQSPRAARSAG
jgi:hypothetical protein